LRDRPGAGGHYFDASVMNRPTVDQLTVIDLVVVFERPLLSVTVNVTVKLPVLVYW